MPRARRLGPEPGARRVTGRSEGDGEGGGGSWPPPAATVDEDTSSATRPGSNSRSAGTGTGRVRPTQCDAMQCGAMPSDAAKRHVEGEGRAYRPELVDGDARQPL